MNRMQTQGNVPTFLLDLAIIIFSSYFIAVMVQFPGIFNPLAFSSQYFINLNLILVLYHLGALSVGLYNSKLRDSFGSIIRRIFFSMAGAYFIGGVILANLFPVLQIQQGIYASVLTLSVVLICISRYFIQDNHVFGVNRKRILIIGTGDRASIIEHRMRRKVDQKGFDLLGYVPMPGDNLNVQVSKDKQLHIKPQDIVQYVDDNRVDCIVIAADERRNVLPNEALFDCKIRGVDILDILDFLERETGQIAVNLIYPSWVKSWT